jgi:hypothetical protein
VEQKKSAAEEHFPAFRLRGTRQKQTGGAQHLEEMLTEIIRCGRRCPKTAGWRRRLRNKDQLSAGRYRRPRGPLRQRVNKQTGAKLSALQTGVHTLLQFRPRRR